MAELESASFEIWHAGHSLFVRYTCALDDGDIDTVVSCFTQNATLESPIIGSYTGLDEVRRFAQRMAALKTEKGIQLRHMVTNLIVRSDGETAHATCYLLPCMTRDGHSELLPPSQYDCTLLRSSGRWLFEHRVVRADHEYVIADI